MGSFGAQKEADRQFPSFVDLYDTHVDELYRFVHKRCRDHGLAEDITQDAFLTALRQHELNEISIGWLKRVAQNRLIDVLRRQSSYATKLRLVGQGDHYDADVADRMQLEEGLEKLRVEHRLVLTLRYIDGLTVAGIATELGRSPKSVEGLITRARRQLRKQLGGSDV